MTGPHSSISLTRRLILKLSAVVCAVSLLGSVILVYYIAAQDRHALESEITDMAQHTGKLLETPLWNMDEEAVRSIGESLALDVDNTGFVCRDSSGKEWYAFRRADIAESILRRAPVIHDGEVLGEVEFYYSIRPHEQAVWRVIQMAVFANLLFLATIFLAAGYMVRGQLRKPLEQLGRIVDGYAKDGCVPESPQSPYQEFHAFETVLLSMASRIQEQIQALRANEQFLNAVVENIPVMIFVKTAHDLCYVRVNKATEQVFGYSREELLGKGDFDFFPAEEAEFFVGKDREVLEMGGILEIAEEPLYTKQGGIRYLHTRKIPLLDEHGAPAYMLGISEDITRRKLAEEARAREVLRAQSYLDVAQVILVALDADARITLLNRKGYQVLGHDPGALEGKDWFQTCLPPEEHKGASAVYKDILSGRLDPAEYHESPILTKGGDRRTIAWHSAIVRDAQGRVTGLLSSGEDITDQKQAQDALKNLAASFAHLSGKKFFSAVCQHIADTLALDYAFVGKLNPSDHSVTVLGGWGCGAPMEPMTYALAGTPCDHVMGKQLCVYPSGIRGRFPKDELLAEMGIEGYCGAPVFDKNEHPIGIIVVLSTRALSDTEPILRLMTVYLDRVAAEMQRVEAQEALRRSEERLTLAKQAAHIGVWDWDVPRDALVWDAFMYRLYGIREADFAGAYEAWLRCVHPEDLPRVNEEIQAALRGEKEYEPEFRIIWPDGSVRFIQAASQTFRDATGKPLRMVGSNIDITARKEAEHKLRISEEKFAKMFQSSPAPVALALLGDIDVFIDVNEAFERVSGYTREEVTGKSSAELNLWEPAESLAQALAILLQEGSLRMFEFNFRRKGGEIATGLISAERLEMYGKTYALASIVDITERKRTEEELRAYRERLEDLVADRTAELQALNKELEAFSYSVSHDLRAPLRGIDGWSQALLDDYGDTLDETAQGYLHTVRAETQRMGLLIDDLLALSRVTRSEMALRELDLSPVAQKVAARLVQEEPSRPVQISIQPEMPVYGDAGLLERLLTNLIGNAWKFTRRTNSAEIEVGTKPLENGRVFYVRDNGAGFDMKYAGKLFGTFQRLHKVSDFEGTGIGLATVQRIVHRHGGRVWAEAQVGQGATFFFTLPDRPAGIAEKSPGAGDPSKP